MPNEPLDLSKAVDTQSLLQPESEQRPVVRRVQQNALAFLKAKKGKADLVDFLDFCTRSALDPVQPEVAEISEDTSQAIKKNLEDYRVVRRSGMGRRGFGKALFVGIPAVATYSALHSVGREVVEIGRDVLPIAERAKNDISKAIENFKNDNAQAINDLGTDFSKEFNLALDRLKGNLDPDNPPQDIEQVIERIYAVFDAVVDYFSGLWGATKVAAGKLIKALMRLLDGISKTLRAMWEQLEEKLGPKAMGNHWEHFKHNFFYGLPEFIYDDLSALASIATN